MTTPNRTLAALAGAALVALCQPAAAITLNRAAWSHRESGLSRGYASSRTGGVLNVHPVVAGGGRVVEGKYATLEQEEERFDPNKVTYLRPAKYWEIGSQLKSSTGRPTRAGRRVEFGSTHVLEALNTHHFSEFQAMQQKFAAMNPQELNSFAWFALQVEVSDVFLCYPQNVVIVQLEKSKAERFRQKCQALSEMVPPRNLRKGFHESKRKPLHFTSTMPLAQRMALTKDWSAYGLRPNSGFSPVIDGRESGTVIYGNALLGDTEVLEATIHNAANKDTFTVKTEVFRCDELALSETEEGGVSPPASYFGEDFENKSILSNSTSSSGSLRLSTEKGEKASPAKSTSSNGSNDESPPQRRRLNDGSGASAVRESGDGVARSLASSLFEERTSDSAVSATHESGLEYGELQGEIAADNMAAHGGYRAGYDLEGNGEGEDYVEDVEAVNGENTDPSLEHSGELRRSAEHSFSSLGGRVMQPLTADELSGVLGGSDQSDIEGDSEHEVFVDESDDGEGHSSAEEGGFAGSRTAGSWRSNSLFVSTGEQSEGDEFDHEFSQEEFEQRLSSEASASFEARNAGRTPRNTPSPSTAYAGHTPRHPRIAAIVAEETGNLSGDSFNSDRCAHAAENHEGSDSFNSEYCAEVAGREDAHDSFDSFESSSEPAEMRVHPELETNFYNDSSDMVLASSEVEEQPAQVVVELTPEEESEPTSVVMDIQEDVEELSNSERSGM